MSPETPPDDLPVTAEEAAEDSYDTVISMMDTLRAYLEEHRGEDTVLSEAHEAMMDHDEAYHPNGFELGERGLASLGFLRVATLLDGHPTASILLNRLFAAEERARSRAIALLRQIYKDYL